MHRPNLRKTRSPPTTMRAALDRLDAAGREQAVRLFRERDRDGIRVLADRIGVHRTALWNAAVYLARRQDRNGIAPAEPVQSERERLDRICGVAR